MTWRRFTVNIDLTIGWEIQIVGEYLPGDSAPTYLQPEEDRVNIDQVTALVWSSPGHKPSGITEVPLSKNLITRELVDRVFEELKNGKHD